MVFEYSYWWIVPMLILSAGVAWFKFKKISKLPDISRGLALLISSLRFIVVFILLFLLLKPALFLNRHIKEKPLLIIAQDNSASLLNGKDSLYYRNEYAAAIKKEITTLSDKYNVEWVTFAQSTEKSENIDFSGNRTDIAGALDYIDNNYFYQIPSAVILLSDGIYNTGINPRYKINAYPVYTVGLGDTTEYPDVYIKNIESDKFNFIKTIFPIKADIAAIRQNGKNVVCTLQENGNKISEQEIFIDSDNFLKEVVFNVEARQKGINRYTITLETGFDERSEANNRGVTFVNIIDNSGDIAFYYSAPHPDIASIVNAITPTGIYAVSEHSLNEPAGDVKANLIILHNPEPNNPNYQKIVKQAEQRKIPLWYILTTRECIANMARFSNTYSIEFGTELYEYVTPSFDRNFPFFEFTEQEISGYSAYPPLVVPLGKINSNAGRTLFTQKIKNTVTTNGIISFYDNNSNRCCYFWGEGLWKWRLYSYRENGNHELFDLLINKTVNYLAAKKGNDRFINDIRPLYDETEEAEFKVELYNDSYELVNTPDVKLALKYNDKDFNYVLNRYGDKYRINLGNLREGEYTYSLTTGLKGENFEKKGIFYVRSQNSEVNDVVANRPLLKDIAVNSGGEYISLEHIDDLVAQLNNNTEFKVKYKNTTEHLDLSEIGSLGLLLLLLLCIEWFLLKYFVS